jgi:putative nucleotidyltransferase with HDIG domain
MHKDAADISATESSIRRSYLPQVILATTVVAVLPAVAVWSVRASGLITSYVLVALLGVALSLIGSYLGRVVWQKRPGSRNLLFSELMVWGYLHRRYTERRLNSARAVLGALSHAQDGMADGLSAERQARLLEQFARALDARDPRTYGHSRRVARYSWMMATRMSLTREQVARIRTAAAIHDIGKIKTPDSVLNKQGALSDEEYGVMKEHAADGALMAVALHDDELTSIVRHHHERLDGTGYPDRLAGEEIPIGSRIIAVADTFDALTANRPYRRAKTHEQALEVLKKEAGSQLDPVAVRVFCAHYAGRRGATLWGWLTSLPERAFEQLSAVASGVGATAKTIAVAALAGTLATSSATLARPAHMGGASSAAPVAVVTRLGTRAGDGATGALRSAESQGGRSAEAPGGGVAKAGAQTAPGESTTNPSGAAPQEQGASGTSVMAPSGGGAKPGEVPASGSAPPVSPRSGGGANSPPSAPSGGGQSGGAGGTVEKVTGKLGGTVEGVKGKVEETKGKVEEVVKGKVEEVKGKVEETKGKVEETKGKVEEVVKGKVEETKGKVEETVGKLKKLLP